MELNFILLIVGILVGAFGALVGAGGGFLVIPFLILIGNFTPQTAIGTSLTMVFFNALSSSVAYSRQKRIDYRTGLWFSLAAFPGTVAGAYLSRFFSGRGFSVSFGIIILLLALFMLLRPSREEAADRESGHFPKTKTVRRLTDAYGHTFIIAYNQKLGAALSSLVGFFSSIFGIGGGIIHVPIMIYLLHFPPHLAVATSTFILALSSFSGALTHFFLGHVQLVPTLLLSAGAIAGAQLGAFWATRVDSRRIVVFLSLALFLVGIRLILG